MPTNIVPTTTKGYDTRELVSGDPTKGRNSNPARNQQPIIIMTAEPCIARCNPKRATTSVTKNDAMTLVMRNKSMSDGAVICAP